MKRPTGGTVSQRYEQRAQHEVGPHDWELLGHVVEIWPRRDLVFSFFFFLFPFSFFPFSIFFSILFSNPVQIQTPILNFQISTPKYNSNIKVNPIFIIIYFSPYYLIMEVINYFIKIFSLIFRFIFHL
jgi:hypothetical protein